MAAAGGGSNAIRRIGPIRLLSVQTRDAEDPFLAMTARGRYLLTWPALQIFGPFFRVEGDTSTALRISGTAKRYGSRTDFDPLSPAIGGDGERAVMYNVRRQRSATNVFFGLALTEAAAGSDRWVTDQLEVPPIRVDQPGGIVLGEHGNLAADWSVSNGLGDRLVLAHQDRFGGPIRKRTVFADPKHLPIAPLQPAFDSSGGLILPFMGSALGCATALETSAHSAKCVPVAQRPMVLTISRFGHVRVQALMSGCGEGPLVQGPNGEAAILLTCPTAAAQLDLYVTELQPDGTFGKPLLVYQPAETANVSATTITIGPGGTVWVAFDYQAPRAKRARFRELRTDITSAAYGTSFGPPRWTTPYTEDFGDAVSEPTLLSSPSGAIYFVSQTPESAFVIQHVLGTGTIGSAVNLSQNGARSATVQVDARGFAIAMWTRTVMTRSRTGASHFRNQIEATEFALP
jgi:hypothetical protein